MRPAILFGALALTVLLFFAAATSVASLFQWLLHHLPLLPRRAGMWIGIACSMATTFGCIFVAMRGERRARA